MKKHILTGVSTLIIILLGSACKKFLDVVPDNIATIDNAFSMRSQAEKYLFTCYSYLPNNGDITGDPAMLGGDEIWADDAYGGNSIYIAKGFQNVVNPYGDTWSSYYRAFRDCNIFLDNIGKVPDMPETEKRRWIAEVKFLKAYYHYYLVRMYGPIPIIKVNLPIDVDVNQTKVYRDPVDSCFNYIVKLLDEATPDLPAIVDDPIGENGRITQIIALSFKAKVLVTAARPLFNGNTDQAQLKNPDGTQLFNTEFSQAKWDSAAVACKLAIDIAQLNGIALYKYNPAIDIYGLSDSIKTQLSIRASITLRWNSEVIWANTQTNTASLQQILSPPWDPALLDQTITRGLYSPTLKIAEMFYSNNGVPITEDNTWNYAGRYTLRTAGVQDSKYIKLGMTTANLNFNREPRFYAALGFDAGIWYGQGIYSDKGTNLYFLAAKFKEIQGAGKAGFGSVSGYYLKKLVHYENKLNSLSSYSVDARPWTDMRLADLYLLYAEALNESAGPGPDVYNYVNLVRARAGLQSVESSWTTYSTNPSKYTTQLGMRTIIHQERLIEMALEGQRFWDLRTWKEATKELNTPVMGWDVLQSNTASYYMPKIIFKQTFGTKDYFWPIKDSYITANRNLVQNLGW